MNRKEAIQNVMLSETIDTYRVVQSIEEAINKFSLLGFTELNVNTYFFENSRLFYNAIRKKSILDKVINEFNSREFDVFLFDDNLIISWVETIPKSYLKFKV